MRDGEVWVQAGERILSPEEQKKADQERKARAEDVRSQYPPNRQGRRAADRKIKKLGL